MNLLVPVGSRCGGQIFQGLCNEGTVDLEEKVMPIISSVLCLAKLTTIAICGCCVGFQSKFLLSSSGSSKNSLATLCALSINDNGMLWLRTWWWQKHQKKSSTHHHFFLPTSK
jgi:hypothetical protein